jgi:uncharacterized membrane protein
VARGLSLQKWLDRAAARKAVLAIVVVAVLVAGIGYYRQQVYYWNNLALGYADCGEVARLMHNTLHNASELFLRVNPDKPLFYDHFQPGVLPLVPLWWVWPDLRLTFLLQVLAIIGSAVPAGWVGWLLWRDKTAALLLAAAWLVYPSTSQMIYSASYGFRWGNLCLPLYFLALGCWLRGWHWRAAGLVVWAMLIKEEAAIPVGMFGLYLALFEKRRRPGLAMAGAAFGYFLLITSVVLPAISREDYLVQRFFSYLGNTKWEILWSPVLRPKIFWGALFSTSTFYFAALLLAPLLFVPLRRPSVLFVGSLVFVFDCLDPMLKSVLHWYQASLLPVVFWALAAALQHAEPVRRRAVLCGCVVAGILLCIFFGNTFWSRSPFTGLLAPGRLELVQRMAHRIAARGSVFATQRAAAHLITQRYLYVDPPLPPQLDGALLDLRNSWWALPEERALRRLRAWQRDLDRRTNLHLLAAEDGLLLYGRDGVPLDRRGVVERTELPADLNRQELPLGHGIKMVGWTIGQDRSQPAEPGFEIVRVTVFTSLEAEVNADVAARCVLEFQFSPAESAPYASKLQPLGQGIWPVSRWSTGRFYADEFLIPVPAELATQPVAVRFAAVSLPQ